MCSVINVQYLLPCYFVELHRNKMCNNNNNNNITTIMTVHIFIVPYHIVFHQLSFYVFLLSPRLSVAKLSGSQLLRFGTLFHKILGYHHQLAPLNTISKLISFLSPASHVPHLATPAPLTRPCLSLCAL